MKLMQESAPLGRLMSDYAMMEQNVEQQKQIAEAQRQQVAKVTFDGPTLLLYPL